VARAVPARHLPASPRNQCERAAVVFRRAEQRRGGGITDYLDFFAGGAFKNFSLFMLGVMPYISMQIIMQLMLVVSPKLKKVSEEDGGKKKIARWTRLGTVFVTIVESYSITVWADRIPNAIVMARIPYMLIATLTVTTGTMFLIWIGEQITKRGIGNGVSLIIFAGIVARLPNALYELVKKIQRDELNAIYAIVVLAMFVLVVVLVIFEQQGQRKIPVNYAKRVVGRKMYGAQNTYIPFKINPSGVIPVIFASSILTFPIQISSSLGVNRSGFATSATSSARRASGTTSSTWP
jgi:preprotein translocase subunit SecY